MIERNWEFRPYSDCSGLEERGSVKGAAADLLWAESCGEESVKPPSLLGERIRSPGRAIRWEVGGWSRVFKFASPCLRRRFMKFMKWEHRRKGSTSGLVETVNLIWGPTKKCLQDLVVNRCVRQMGIYPQTSHLIESLIVSCCHI